MIKIETCYIATCDVCGDQPESDYGGVAHSSNDGDALEEARVSEWWATPDSTVLCTEWDAKHIVKAREIVASLPLSGEGVSDFRFWTPPHIWDEIAPPEPPASSIVMPGQLAITEA